MGKKAATVRFDAPDLDDDEDLEPAGPGVFVDDADLSSLLVADGAFDQVSLRRCSIELSKLVRTSWTGSRVQHARLFDVVFVEADLSNCDWPALTARRVEFRQCKLTGAALNELDAQDVLFDGCRGALSHFAEAKLAHCRFVNCELSEANFEGADLSGTRFSTCRLSGANFEGAQLEGADLRGSDIDGVEVHPRALKGVVIDAAQALDLVGLMGVVVRPLDEER